ncbi:MAG: NADH-quinone oxidoreductase subunit C [Methanomicrobiales archaeon]|nr:NADH-quinone oxidoreductase subunit C [Methanomicrobiales archaeon]MDI6877181.1 NADH-quinone oxidoreductase subunit C [Methanomicrobiales archaeon]
MRERVQEPQEILEVFQKRFGTGIRSAEIREYRYGRKKNANREIWIRVDRSIFRDLISALVAIDYPHLGVISGADNGEEVELIYHLFIYYGEHLRETAVNIGVSLPKSDLTIPTITDIIPGALTSEREKQEMLGVTVEGIPDARRLFLPDDFPAGVYPWRKDASGVPDEMVKNLSEVGRPAYREAHRPVVEPGGGVCETCAGEGEHGSK